MPLSTYFVQECPTCGRRLEVRIQHLGKDVVCQHCRGTFTAAHPQSPDGQSSDSLLRRADELLHLAELQAEFRAGPATSY